MTISVNVFKTINNETIKESFENAYVDYLEDIFENSPNYKLVTINSGTTEYKTLIKDYDKSKNLIGYKFLISYPYTTCNFNVGDYINFEYGGVTTNWLIFALDKQFTYNVNGKIKKCNNVLKWLDSNGNELTYKCVIEDKINNSDLDENKQIIIPEGGIIVHCQLNTYTDEISENYRFIFGKQVFKVNALIDYASTGFITFIMKKCAINDNDDFVNGIANNNLYNYTLTIDQDNFTQNVSYTTTLTSTIILDEEIVNKSVIWSSSDENKATIDDNGVLELLSTGTVIITCTMSDNVEVSDSITIIISASLPSENDTIISPNNTTLYQGQSQTYTIYNYIDDVIQLDTFTITSSGVSTDNYTISVTDNGFTVTNIKSYTTSPLVITCVNNVSSEVTTFNIELKGFW